MKTVFPTKEAAAKNRKWVVVDAAGKPLGRVASRVASVLRGKHKTSFSPHVDAGDFVVIVNADQVRLTGNKALGKVYFKHTGFPGGIKSRTASEIQSKNSAELIRLAVKGMLPSGPLGYGLIQKLKVYSGQEHPHKAQTPEPMAV